MESIENISDLYKQGQIIKDILKRLCALERSSFEVYLKSLPGWHDNNNSILLGDMTWGTSSNALILNRIYWNYSTTNTLPTESEIASWTNNAEVSGSVSIPFYQFNSVPRYLIYAEPYTEPAKDNYYFSDDDKGPLGTDGPWARGVKVGGFRVYITNYATQTGNTPIQFKVNTP